MTNNKSNGESIGENKEALPDQRRRSEASQQGAKQPDESSGGFEQGRQEQSKGSAIQANAQGLI